jgi:hypothetical protein
VQEKMWNDSEFLRQLQEAAQRLDSSKFREW